MAKRRANGEGNIRKRKDDRWEGRYTAGTDPVTGKAIVKNVLGKTQTEVKEKLKKAIAESENLDIKRSGMYTAGEWMDLWYEVYAKPRIRESTAVYYKMFIDTHIRPKLGDIKLNQLQTMDIQRLYNELRENGRIRKEIKDKQPGLSVSYIRGMHNMLKSCLNSAVDERLILRNPAMGCKLPRAEKKEMKVLTQEQLGSYLAAANARGLLPMFFLELTTGLRKGELVPLLWSDVDTENMTISITKQAYRMKGGMKVQPPKTGNSMRKIALSEETMELLKQEHDKHPGNPYLFPSPVNGGIVSMTWAWGLCPGGWGSWIAKSAIMPLETNCCSQNSRTRTAYWSGGISLGMVSTHRLASWEFHCFSTASAAFHKVLRSAYDRGAFAGSRISLWTIPRFSG